MLFVTFFVSFTGCFVAVRQNSWGTSLGYKRGGKWAAEGHLLVQVYNIQVMDLIKKAYKKATWKVICDMKNTRCSPYHSKHTTWRTTQGMCSVHTPWERRTLIYNRELTEHTPRHHTLRSQYGCIIIFSTAGMNQLCMATAWMHLSFQPCRNEAIMYGHRMDASFVLAM